MRSDVISKREGSYVERPKRPSEKKSKLRNNKRRAKELKGKKKRKKGVVENGTATAAGAAPVQNLPNRILFVENLPEKCNNMMISMLFQQYEGYKEVRLVPNKPGIAFVEFESHAQSAQAMTALQNFKITPTNLMKITYSKQG